MSELSKYGEIGDAIHADIERTVVQKTHEVFEPVRMLKDYENVDVLTFDEACKVLRLTKDELYNAIKADLVPCVRLGRSIWQFPKRLLIEYLLGNWKKDEPVKLNKAKNFESKVADFVS